MTLDEAIKHAGEVMVENLEKTKGRNASDPIAMTHFECAEEHRQLAEWLKELKQLREHNEKLINEYISKVGCCDECFASVYCTVNGLRESRVPQDYCVKNIERYFNDKTSPTGAEVRDKE